MTSQESSLALRACRAPASTQFPSFQFQDLRFLASLAGPYLPLARVHCFGTDSSYTFINIPGFT